jgi:hypothetical protein
VRGISGIWQEEIPSCYLFSRPGELPVQARPAKHLCMCLQEDEIDGVPDLFELTEII